MSVSPLHDITITFLSQSPTGRNRSIRAPRATREPRKKRKVAVEKMQPPITKSFITMPSEPVRSFVTPKQCISSHKNIPSLEASKSPYGVLARKLLNSRTLSSHTLDVSKHSFTCSSLLYDGLKVDTDKDIKQSEMFNLFDGSPAASEEDTDTEFDVTSEQLRKKCNANTNGSSIGSEMDIAFDGSPVVTDVEGDLEELSEHDNLYNKGTPDSATNACATYLHEVFVKTRCDLSAIGIAPSDSEIMYCPSCQAPSNLLQPLDAHVEICLTTFRPPALICPDDAQCCKLNPDHFLFYSHNKLTRLRSTHCSSLFDGNRTLLPPPVTPGLVATVKASTLSSISYVTSAVKKFQSGIGGFFGIPSVKMDTKTMDKKLTSKPSTLSAKKACPFYKWIPGTRFTVDAFRYGIVENCAAYFLSHFHSDHYGGLVKSFTQPIYCSQGTANLVTGVLKVNPLNVHVLPMNAPVVIAGVEVTLLDANHCPGAVVFIFHVLTSGSTVLHTGDFRASAYLWEHPCLLNRRIDTLFLDTTYCSAEYIFPAQEEVLEFVRNIVRTEIQRRGRPLFIVGTYSIGKEKVFEAVREVLNTFVFVSPEKMKVCSYYYYY